MLKINWKKKLIAMLLIFTLTFGNFAIVGKAYAATIFDGLFTDNKGDTGSSNVEFDACFLVYDEDDPNEPTEMPETDEANSGVKATSDDKVSDEVDEVSSEDEASPDDADKASSDDADKASSKEADEVNSENEKTSEDRVAKPKTKVTADVKSNSIKLKLAVKVSNSGYLKDAKISLGNGEELNFAFNAENLENKAVQSFVNNEIELVQLKNGSEVEIELPIYYEASKYVQLDKISKTNKINFEGTYIDGEKEISVSKKVDLKLSWQDEREVSVDSEVTKYIGYSADGVSGVILQMLVKADNTTTEKTLPVKSSILEVEVPEINGIKPESMAVAANSLLGTTGKSEAMLDEDKINYDEEKNILNITVDNKSQLVSPQSEEEVLIDETLEDIEAYYAGSGIDEYLITYIYKDISIEDIEITSNIVSTFNMYGGTTLKDTQKAEYVLSDEVGDIVTLSVQSDNEPVSKGYTYLNYNNEENKYEIILENKLIFNISYKDIVEGLYYADGANYYVSNAGEKYEQNDIYYKSLKISKTNFDEILGEEGYIKISDNQGNLLTTINNEMKLDEGVEVYEINFEEPVNKIKIETSKPITEGNLFIDAQKAYKDVSYNKESFKEFSKISMESIGKAKYIYLNELSDCGKATTDIEFKNTITDAEIIIGQETLSTLAINNDVEMKIVLNNEDISSDVYGESAFEIKMPEYIESLEVTDYNIVYGNGLELSNVSAYEENGSTYLRVDITGKQTELSSGIISGGTNIVLKVNIKVNLYAPAAEADFELRYVNSDATKYAETLDGIGYSKATVKYSAPSGLVSVNSISNYNDNGDIAVSVKQGTVMGNLPIYAPSKTATMDLIVMNNEQNSISNFSILGRTIFEGNTDILTGESLGTTISAPMVGSIVSDANNSAEFITYYSTNPEATKDLSDEANGWSTEVEDLRSVKSYLIVPVDENYELNVSSKLHFLYEFEVPANLTHNEYLYGVFGTYYTNDTAVATLDEVSLPDLVGLTTGEGPELDIKLDLSKEIVSEYEEFEAITTVKNIGKVTAENVTIKVPYSSNVSYSNSKTSIDGVNIEVGSEEITYILDTLEADTELKITSIFEIKEQSSTNQQEKIDVYSIVTADDLDVALQSEVKTISLKQAEAKIWVEDSYNEGRGNLSPNDSVKIYIYAQNLTSEVIENAQVSMYLDDAFDFEKGTINLALEAENEDVKEKKSEKTREIRRENATEREIAKFDEKTRMVTWNVGAISPKETIHLSLDFNIKALTETANSKDVEFSAILKSDTTSSEYTSKPFQMTVGSVYLTITQKTRMLNTYITEGAPVEYIFEIKNEGTATASDVTFMSEVSKGLSLQTVDSYVDGVDVTAGVYGQENFSKKLRIPAGETAEITMNETALALHGEKERSVTSKGAITYKEQEITANSITHIVEADPNKTDTEVPKGSSSSAMGNALRTYKISGVVWKDTDKNGARENTEELLKGIKATLVNSDTGIIKQSVTTNSKGEYTFTGVDNGNYIVIFDYDTTLYSATTYRKENVLSNVNSDAISTQIEQEGNIRSGAVTEVITVSDLSVSNIDLGLTDALTFDLNLDVAITKVTVQNKKGTTTKNYNSNDLIKTEISQKYISGSEVYVEYTFKVKNEGEAAGYAKKIVDYIPEGMNFNSSLNSAWFTGNDGNLYTTTLENTEIKPGETKTFKLVLTKTMTAENTGRVSNTAEIVEDYNIYGISDIDSKPGNNSQSEDDFARTDIIISVGTGAIYIYISLVITTVILVGIAVFVVLIKKKSKLVKEGGV